MVSTPTQLERIATLEVELKLLQEEIKEDVRRSEERHNEMSSKLDDLLALKQKGLGAFWLVSSLFGIGFVSIFTEALSWLKGVLHG